jgi:hypothetical protein
MLYKDSAKVRDTFFQSHCSLIIIPKCEVSTLALISESNDFSSPHSILIFIPLLSHLVEVALHSVAC